MNNILKEVIRLNYLDCPVCENNSLIFVKSNGKLTKNIDCNKYEYIQYAHCESCNRDFIIDWTNQCNPTYIIKYKHALHDIFIKYFQETKE